MLDIFLIWGPCALLFLFVALFGVWAWFQFPKRTADDLLGFLRHVDMDLVYKLVDPVAEGMLRSTMTSREFRRMQVKRVHLCTEQIRRMAHNATVVLELAKKESASERSDVRKCAALVNEKGVIVRVFCLSALLKLRLRILIRIDIWSPFGGLTLCEIREAFGVRGIQSYDELKTAASYLFLLLQNSNFEELIAAL